MDNAQFSVLIAAITGGLGGLAAVIKWSVAILTKSLDGNTAAHLKSVEVMTAMSTKMDFVYQQTGRVRDFMNEERSDVHDQPEQPISPKYTPRKTPRLKTAPGEDE